MKTHIYLSQPELQNQIIQALSDAKLIDKVELSILPASSQLKLEQSHDKTKIRTCLMERTADNSIVCKACGRKLPSTPQGDLDLDQLVHEIGSRPC